MTQSAGVLCTRNEIRVILMLAFKFQEIVVPALTAVGILAADIRACQIDGAATRFGVKETADRPVDLVFPMAHDLLDALIGLVASGKFSSGRLNVQIEVLCQSLNVRFM